MTERSKSPFSLCGSRSESASANSNTAHSHSPSQTSDFYIIKAEEVEWEVRLDKFVVVGGDEVADDPPADSFHGDGSESQQCDVVSDKGMVGAVLSDDLTLFEGMTPTSKSESADILRVTNDEVGSNKYGSECPSSGLGSHSTVTMTTTLPDTDMSAKERMRRERVRQRKLAQRQNVAFRERERRKARERMKTLRNDPVYRQHERQRDRERRKKARLNNQVQRAREREKDRVRKSLMRSAHADRQSGKLEVEGFQLLLGVSESDEGEEGEEEVAVGWGT